MAKSKINDLIEEPEIITAEKVTNSLSTTKNLILDKINKNNYSIPVNVNEFNYFGRNLKNGYFKNINPESYEWLELWQEEYDKCINGCFVGGRYISGILYSYVNFGTILKLDEHTGFKSKGLPNLREIDFTIDHATFKALVEEKGIMLVAGRRLGKSFFASWLNVYFSVFLRQETCIGAFDKDKVGKYAEMVVAHLNGLLDTEFGQGILKQDDKVVILGHEEQVNKIWKRFEYGGKIYKRIFKNNTTAANGLSTAFFAFEEIGMFDNLAESYRDAEPCWKEGTKVFGLPFLLGTGGDMDGGGSIDAKKMSKDPDAYNLLTFEIENTNKRTILFIPGYEGFHDLRDSNGRLDKEKGIEVIIKKRAELEKANDLKNLYKYMQYYPLTIEEAFMTNNRNLFPIELIQHQINQIESNSHLSKSGTRGKLVFHNGNVIFCEDHLARECPFPLESDNIRGCLTIYEEPYRDSTGKIPNGLYIAGCDPYAQDKSKTSPSLGSVFIYKRFLNPFHTSDIIVAELTDRPNTTDEFHEDVRKLLLYFNARCLYENQITGLKTYLQMKNSLHLLQPQPSIIKDIIDDSKVDREYGIHMNDKIKMTVMNKIRNYLLTEYAPNKFKIDHIYCVNLLREMLAYDPEEGNYDRLIAFGLALLQDMEDHKIEVIENDEEQKRGFWGNLFEKDNWNGVKKNQELRFKML